MSMSEKKARGRRRALRRSRENDRLNRKVASLEQSAHEREFDRLIAEARTERAEAMKAANAAFEKALKALENERKKHVQEAEAAYIEKRDGIVSRLARDKAKAA